MVCFVHIYFNRLTKYLFLGIFSLVFFQASDLSAQIVKYDQLSGLSVEIKYGFSFPEISGGNSLSVGNVPSNPQDEIIFQETNLFSEAIEEQSYLGLQLKYKLSTHISAGIFAEFRNSYNYHSSSLFFQNKKVISNDLMVSSMGSFDTKSRINITTSHAVVSVILFQFELNNVTKISLQTNIGAGVSFIKLTSEVSDVFLRMNVSNSNTSQNNILGPGRIAPTTDRFSPFSYQLDTGLKVDFSNEINMKIGCSLSHLGRFIIMERPKGMENLFTLSSTVTGGQDQNLVLKSTNSMRKIISKDIYISMIFNF